MSKIINNTCFAIIDRDDNEILFNIAEKNNITINQIVGLLLDGYINELVKKNHWKCDYNLKNGSPWQKLTN